MMNNPLAYLLSGLIVLVVTYRVVRSRDRSLRGGRVGAAAIVGLWPLVLPVWAFAVAVGLAHTLVENIRENR